ncbi:unnamed protein product [marine sediment metagenome]|uniref:Uncharacterized protein n=1 Tax=marine sediment metagenome TaxID=412755 RepID=X0TVC8_9ZZZZ
MELHIFRRGKEFETREKSEWLTLDDGYQALFEKTIPTAPGRRGRIDVLIQEKNGSLTIIEIKSTNWDKIKPYRIRQNVLRHIRQVLSYLTYFHEKGIDVCLAICYPCAPSSKKTRLAIEQLFESKWVQVVWTNERET